MSLHSQRRIVSWRLAFWWIIIVIILLPAADLVERLSLYNVLGRDRSTIYGFIRRPTKDLTLALLHHLSGKPNPTPLVPVWDFYLKPQDEESLRSQLTRFQVQGDNASNIPPLWIPARMRTADSTYDVRLRLRGQQYYHGVRPRPSLRVRLRRGQTYNGSTVFNLIEPFDKITDLVFLWEAQAHGLMAWNTDLGFLAFRGRPVALVHYVEQFRRSTTDRSQRPEGMLFKGNGRIYELGDDPERCSDLVEDVSRWFRDTHTILSFDTIRSRIDIDYFRWFTALTELSGSRHGFFPVNIKGYCNPVSLLAEFIIWDTSFGRWAEVDESVWAEWGTQFLRNDQYRLLHDETLYTLVNERIKPMLDRLRAFYDKYGQLIGKDPFIWFPRGGEAGGWMFQRQRHFEELLHQNASDIRAALEGESLDWHVDEGRHQLIFRTTDRGSKQITGLKLETETGSQVWNFPEPIIVYGRFGSRQPVVETYVPSGVNAASISGIIASNFHTARPIAARRIHFNLNPTVVLDTVEPVPAVIRLPAGFRSDPQRRHIIVGPGLVQYNKTLSLPRHWSVEVKAGTILEAGPDALLEVNGDLHMLGTPLAPILIRPASAHPWGAIAVSGERLNPANVQIAHTTVIGGKGSNAGRVRYTATMSIYYSNVHIDHLTVRQSVAEDALNLKYCTFTASQCQYLDGAGDAVDYDFSTGRDIGSRIDTFPDDAIDISGSVIRVEDAVIQNIGDKGLSIGEKSRAVVVNAQVLRANVACAIKDLSNAHVDRLTVLRSNTAVSIYTKKPTFGPAQASFTQVLAIGVRGLAIVDTDNQLEFVKGVRISSPAVPVHPHEGVQDLFEESLPLLTDGQIITFARRHREKRDHLQALTAHSYR